MPRSQLQKFSASRVVYKFCSFLVTVHLALGFAIDGLMVIPQMARVLSERLSRDDSHEVMSGAVKASFVSSWQNWSISVQTATVVLSPDPPPVMVAHLLPLTEAHDAIGSFFKTDLSGLGLGSSIRFSPKQHNRLLQLLADDEGSSDGEPQGSPGKRKGTPVIHETVKRKIDLGKGLARTVGPLNDPDEDHDDPLDAATVPARASKVKLYRFCRCTSVGDVVKFGTKFYSVDALMEAFDDSCTSMKFEPDLVGSLLTETSNELEFLARIPERIPDEHLSLLHEFWRTDAKKWALLARKPEDYA